MADLISYPFRLAESGRVVTVRDGSDDAITEQIAVLVLTIAGERPLVPGFGLPDPAYSELDTEALSAALALFGPDVVVSDVLLDETVRDQQRVVITWHAREQETGDPDAVT